MTDPTTLTVFVNERAVRVPAGARARDAVHAFDASEGAALDGGARRLADSRGLDCAADAVLHGGAILRLLPVRTVPADGASADAATAEA